MKKIKNIFVFLVLLFLFMPLFILFIYSFNSSSLNITFEGFSFMWYVKLFQNKELLSAFFNTIIIAVSSTIISTIIGTTSAVILNKYNFYGKKFINYLLYMPIVMPEIVLGISLLSIYTLFKLELSIYTILLSHIVFSIPFVIVSVRSVLNEIGDEVMEASYDLGANKIQTFFFILLPLLKEGIKSGAILSFTLSLDDVVISYFTAGPGSNTLPLKIYSMIKTGVTPDVYALTTLVLVIVISVMGIKSSGILKRRKIGY